jgi:hypothetical protein
MIACGVQKYDRIAVVNSATVMLPPTHRLRPIDPKR